MVWKRERKREKKNKMHTRFSKAMTRAPSGIPPFHHDKCHKQSLLSFIYRCLEACSDATPRHRAAQCYRPAYLLHDLCAFNYYYRRHRCCIITIKDCLLHLPSCCKTHKIIIGNVTNFYRYNFRTEQTKKTLGPLLCL